MNDLVGRRFGRLVVISAAPDSGVGRKRWLSKCDCGEVRAIHHYNLTLGKSKSCGCLSSDITKTRNRVHGQHGSPEYICWKAIRQRCLNPKIRRWADYGGRGITICERWHTFGNFLADMGQRPSPKHSVDRIDNDGNYEPSNCRWATKAEQAANSRACRPVTLHGVTRTQAEWCRILGVKPATVSNRIHRNGWSPERALTEPLQASRRALRAPPS